MNPNSSRHVWVADMSETKPLALAERPPGLELDRIGAIVGAVTVVLWVLSMMVDGTPAGAARAAGGSDDPLPASTAAGPEWLNGGYFGMPYTHSSDVRFVKPGSTDLTAHDVNWDGKPFKSPIYYGLRSLRWNGGGQGVMVDFTHSKTISQPDQTLRFSGQRNGRPAPGSSRNGDVFRHLEFSHGHNMLTLNRLWQLGWLSPAIRPYAGAGAGVALPHTEIQFAGDDARTYEYQYAGPVGQVLAGIEIRLPRASVFVEYKFSLARYSVPLTGTDSRGWGYVDFILHLLSRLQGVQPAHGTATTTLASHQIIGGVGLRSPVAAAMPAP